MENTVTLIGNLTKDPEIIGEGTKARTRGSIASNQKYIKYTPDGDVVAERTVYNDFIIWGKRGINFAEQAKKGTRVILLGTVGQSTRETASGEKIYQTQITVDEAGISTTFGVSKKKSSTPPSSTEPPPSQTDPFDIDPPF